MILINPKGVSLINPKGVILFNPEGVSLFKAVGVSLFNPEGVSLINPEGVSMVCEANTGRPTNQKPDFRYYSQYQMPQLMLHSCLFFPSFVRTDRHTYIHTYSQICIWTEFCYAFFLTQVFC